MRDCLTLLSSLIADRDEQMEQALDELAESKFSSQLEIKKKYKLKIALAKGEQTNELTS